MPDLAYHANHAAQKSEKLFSIAKVWELDHGFRMVQKSGLCELHFVLLGISSVHTQTYSDAAFAMGKDLSSPLAYIVHLADKKNNCNLLDIAREKSKRKIISIMGGENYLFMNGFHVAHTM